MLFCWLNDQFCSTKNRSEGWDMLGQRRPEEPMFTRFRWPPLMPRRSTLPTRLCCTSTNCITFSTSSTMYLGKRWKKIKQTRLELVLQIKNPQIWALEWFPITKPKAFDIYERRWKKWGPNVGLVVLQKYLWVCEDDILYHIFLDLSGQGGLPAVLLAGLCSPINTINIDAHAQ